MKYMRTRLNIAGLILPLMVVCLAGCRTEPVASPHSDVESFEYVAQILAMPSRTATATEIGPCYAAFKSVNGRTFFIGSPGSPAEVVGFLRTLEKGKSYFLPDAFMDYQKTQKPPNKATGSDLP